MNEFLVFFLMVSIFASNALCMNPSTLGLSLPPPPEEDVEFSYCFFVHGITGEALDTEYHSYEYHHICSRKPAFPHYETTWYFVGSFNGAEILSQVLPKHYYIVMLQSHMKFVFLKETKVKLRIEDMEYEITFQSLEQSQAFYLMIPHDIAMKYAAPTPIGVLHEIMRDESGFKKMGNNVEALYENIDYTRHITFINGDGEPLLIFSQAEQESSILRTKQKQTDRLQLILRVNTQYYLLTFSSNVEAHRFSQALSKFLKPLHLGQLQGYYKSRFENNDITINS